MWYLQKPSMHLEGLGYYSFTLWCFLSFKNWEECSGGKQNSKGGISAHTCCLIMPLMDRAYCWCRNCRWIQNYLAHLKKEKKYINPSVFIKHKGKPSTQNAQSQQITVKCQAMLGKAVLQCLSQGICYWLLLELGLYETNSSAEPADHGWFSYF